MDSTVEQQKIEQAAREPIVYSTYMVMTSYETQIQMFADWSMAHAECVTTENRQKLRIYHVVMRKLRIDKIVLQKHGQTMLK